jgi:hypothetical protein
MAEKKYIVCIRFKNNEVWFTEFNKRKIAESYISDFNMDSIDSITVYYGFVIKPIIKTTITIPEVIED